MGECRTPGIAIALLLAAGLETWHHGAATVTGTPPRPRLVFGRAASQAAPWMGQVCRVSIGGVGGMQERWLGASLPFQRLRGGVDELAGDISYQSGGGGEDGIDPYGESNDGRLPDSFPDNPESLAGLDDTEEIVIDADEHQRMVKEGTPGPDNLEARDDYVDNEVSPTNDLMHLLSTSRPSGITARACGKVDRGVDEYDVRGPSYPLAQAGREYFDDFASYSHRLTAEEVIAEVHKDEKAKQDRKERAASEKGVPHAAASSEKIEDVDESRGVFTEEDDAEEHLMVSCEGKDRAARARSMHVSEMGGPEHPSAETGKGDLHVKKDVDMAGLGAQDGLVNGARVKFANDGGGMSYGVIRMAPETPDVGGEGKGPGNPGKAGVRDDHLLVECIDETSCTEMRRVPRAILQLVKAGYLSVPVAPSPRLAGTGIPRDAAARGRSGVEGGSEGAAANSPPLGRTRADSSAKGIKPDGSAGGALGAAARGDEARGAGARRGARVYAASGQGSARKAAADPTQSKPARYGVWRRSWGYFICFVLFEYGLVHAAAYLPGSSFRSSAPSRVWVSGSRIKGGGWRE